MHAASSAAVRSNWADGSIYVWAITDGTPDLLGTVALHVGERTAVGYWVAPWARNRGLATRAVETLLRVGARRRAASTGSS